MSGFVPPGPGQPPEEPPGSPPHQPYPTYPQQPHYDGAADAEAASSRKLAGWALGLSFLFVIPVAPLVAIGLAITALVQGSRPSRDGRPRNHGTGMAIAALPIAGLSLIAAIALIASGVVGDFDPNDDAERDEEGQVTEPTDIPALNLRVGDCANDPDLAELGPDETGETYEIEAVPCRLPHDLEVFHGFDLPDGDYPGEEAIFREAEKQCGREAQKFLGGLKGAARLGVSYYFPKETSWRLYDDRKVLCIIAETGQQSVGTLEGTGRR